LDWRASPWQRTGSARMYYAVFTRGRAATSELGQNEPCHSLRRHVRSTSVSGPAGSAVGASRSAHQETRRPRKPLGRSTSVTMRWPAERICLQMKTAKSRHVHSRGSCTTISRWLVIPKSRRRTRLTQVQKRLNNYYGTRRHFHLRPLAAARRREVKRCGRINSSAPVLPVDARLDAELRKNCGRVALRRHEQRQQRDASFRRDADAKFSAGRFDEMCHRVS